MKTQTQNQRISEDIENLKNWLKECQDENLKRSIREQIEIQKQLLKKIDDENKNKNR